MNALHLAGAWGQQALWIWVVGAGLMGAGVWLLQRACWAEGAPGATLTALGLRMSWAWVCVVVAGAGFAGLAEHVGSGESRFLGRLDEAVIAGIRSGLQPAALAGMAVVSHLGDRIFLTAWTVVLGVVLWSRGRRALAWGWVLAVAGNGVLIRVLKALFERTRPEHFHELAVVDGFSFPSGHASGAMVVYGWTAYLALHLLSPRWHAPVVIGMAVGVWTVGCSRVLLQVHFPSDVLAGWLSGGAWLVASIAALEGWRHHRRRSRFPHAQGVAG